MKMHALSEHELVQIEGGGFWAPLIPFLSAALGLAAGAIVDGWSDFKEGFEEAFWHQQNLAQ